MGISFTLHVCFQLAWNLWLWSCFPNIFAFPFSIGLVSIPMSELRLHMVDYTHCLVPVKISKVIWSSGVLLMAVLSGLTLCGFIELKDHIDKPCCEHVLSASVVLGQYLIHAHTRTCTQTKHSATLSAEFSYFPSNLSNAWFPYQSSVLKTSDWRWLGLYPLHVTCLNLWLAVATHGHQKRVIAGVGSAW